MEKKDRIFIEIIIALILGTVAVYLFFEAKEEPTIGRVNVDSGKRVVMGTLAHVIAVAADSNTAERCIEAAFAKIEEIEDLMSDHKSDSEIGELNRDGFNRAIVVSEPTYEVLQKGVEFSRISDGAFDITIGPLVDFWHSAAEANSVPSEAELAEVRSKVGYDKLIFGANEMSIRFAADGMRVDLGGIAKGYALDKAVEAMQKKGAAGGMVDIGGDIRCFGLPPGGQDKWRIGLQDTRVGKEDLTGGILMVLELGDTAVATSGDYRRYVVIDGKKYSHIIDAKTGYSGDGLASVTIITETAVEADALATAVNVMGAERGLALIEERPGTEAIVITSAPEYELKKTSGALQYIEK